MKNVITKSRIEYLSHGVNWWTGCSHGCRYCYMRALARRFNREMPTGKWGEPTPRVHDPHVALDRELARRRSLPRVPIMLSTSHDPAMSQVVARQTRDIVEVLTRHDMAALTLLLTKAPRRALDALGVCGANEGLRFGISLTSLDEDALRYYEPHAEWSDRLRGIARAAAAGYQTWVSIEPPLPGVRLSDLVRAVLETNLRPWIVLGKMNHNGEVVLLADWAQSPSWGAELAKSLRLLRAAGYQESIAPQDGGYWVKHELRRLLPA